MRAFKRLRENLSGVIGDVSGGLGIMFFMAGILIAGLIDWLVRLPRPRMAAWSVLALALVGVNYFLQPEQFHLMLWKLNLVAIAIVLGYWADRGLSPYARPHEFLSCGEDADPRAASSRAVIFGLVQIARAIVVFAVIHGVTQGV